MSIANARYILALVPSIEKPQLLSHLWVVLSSKFKSVLPSGNTGDNDPLVISRSYGQWPIELGNQSDDLHIYVFKNAWMTRGQTSQSN